MIDCKDCLFEIEFINDEDMNLEFSDEDDMGLGFDEIIKVSTTNYDDLYNKPKINGVELVGDKSLEELGDTPLTNLEIKAMFNNIFGT